MKHSTQLSVILTTHAKSEFFHTLLADVLAMMNKKLEVIIIDDSRDVVTSQFIEREVNKCENEKVFLYTHEKSTGRGASLNEALIHASGDLIWAPLRADRLNETLLDEAIRRFKADPAAFWVMDYNLPSEPMDWVNAADEGELPDDSALVWNRNVIPDEQLFFNPYLEHLHGAELAFRLKEENVWHKTDPFFIIADDQSQHAGFSDIQEFLYTALRLSRESELRKPILNELANVESRINNRVPDDELLVQARRHLQQNDANKSLEIINRFLKRNPDHHEAIRIKITSLEKLRRHVEAAELKHSLQKQPRAADEPLHHTPHRDQDPYPEQAVDREQDAHDEKHEETAETVQIQEKQSAADGTTVVIPTTGHGKNLLEKTLVQLEKAVNPAVTELIVIDNASIDDTFEYLEQLSENAFLNIRVITNTVNKGFGASVNQGIESASHDYVLVMHNDVELPVNSVERLQNAFSIATDAGIVAPAVRSTRVKAQNPDSDIDEDYVLAEHCDSCCFMIRKSLPVRFDEDYGLCYFETEDFCKQVIEKDLSIIISRDIVAEHHPDSTTRLMGLDLNPELKWENRARYYRKWNGATEYKMPVQGTHPEKFLRLGAPYNPMKPEQEWVNIVQDYLTSETRTEILRGDWTQDELLTIILTLLIADERELLRTMEDKLNGFKPDASLLLIFIYYYYRKNIYSRCKHYINLADRPHPVFDLFHLKILVAEKNFKEAGEVLNKMLELYPSSPELYHLAAEMYHETGEEEEADLFYTMASQLDPIRFKKEGPAFELTP
jgi:glycosyltransferase involved in cell wall biosynthesis